MGVSRVVVHDDTEKTGADVQAAIELDGNEVPRRVEEKIDSLYKSRNIEIVAVFYYGEP